MKDYELGDCVWLIYQEKIVKGFVIGKCYLPNTIHKGIIQGDIDELQLRKSFKEGVISYSLKIFNVAQIVNKQDSLYETKEKLIKSL